MPQIFFKIWQFLHLPKNFQLFLMRKVNDQFLVGVTGIFLDNKNRILLFKHTYRGDNHWSLPGGYLKGKEHPKEGLEREIMEESGLTVSADERLKIRTDRNSSRLEIVYTGKYIGGSFTPSNEVKEMGFFPFEKLPDIPKDQLIFIDKALPENRV
jgi:ADP-ribose pyrophosphatase YjhB (NUDIX family)